MQDEQNKASRGVNWHIEPADCHLMPSPQAQTGLQTALNMPYALLAVAAAVATAFVTAVEAAVAGAVTDAAGVIDTF